MANIKINIFKYQWTSSQGTGDYNRNFFNTDITKKPTEIIADRLDLYNYLVKDSLSEIEYNFDSYNFATDKLVGESSGVSLKVNNLHLLPDGTRNFSDYFYIYSDDKQYYKYVIDIYSDTGTLVYKGILTNEGIKFNDRIKEQIELSITGFEDEFKKYFENRSLVDIEALGLYNNIEPIGGGLIGNTGGETPQYANLINVLSSNMPSNYFWYGFNVLCTDNTSTEAFYIMKRGYMYAPCQLYNWSKGSMFIKAGYENFYNQGTNAFQYFTSMCNAMGWIWYFKLHATGKPMIIIQQRSQLFASANILSLNFSDKSIGHSINSNEYDIKADIIMISSGRLTFGTNANDSSTGYDGLQKVLITNGANFSGHTDLYNVRGFDYNTASTKPYTARTSAWTGTDSAIVLNEIQDYDYKFNRVTDFNVYERFSRDRDSILEIPVINNENYNTAIDLSNVRYNTSGSNYYWNGVSVNKTTLNQYDMSFYGNPGECIVRRTFNAGIYKYETYNDYIATEKFRKNFYKYLRGKTGTIINVTVNQLITNPAQTVYITGYDSDNRTNNALINGKYYAILGLKFNLINNTTELKLQRLS